MKCCFLFVCLFVLSFVFLLFIYFFSGLLALWFVVKLNVLATLV